MKTYLKKACELGFSEAVLVDELSLESKEQLRAYCNPQQCPNHGGNWVCPPACGTLEECHKKLMEFRQGIVVQSVTDLIPPVNPEIYKKLNREHNMRLKKFVESLESEVGKILTLTTGGCIFCESCCYPEPCIHPEKKMESLSAFGIDVGELCVKAGLSYSFREDRVYLTALVLFKTV